MTEPEQETPPLEPGPANEHEIPGDVLQRCLDEAADEQARK